MVRLRGLGRLAALMAALALLWAMAAGALSEETASSLRIDFTVQPSVL